MTAPKVSIVIVNWNAASELVACLRSLEANPPAAAWEAIVVDNGSTHGSIEAVRSDAPRTHLIANQINRGLAAANNQGISAARGETIIISNPDVLFRSGSIDALVDILGRRPRAAFAFARLLESDGSVQTCAGALPSFREALLGRNYQSAVRRQPPSRSLWWDGWAHNEEIAIGHGGEACYAVRRQALDTIGLQDERYVLDWEGIEWCARAWEAGWEAWFCPGAEVVHVGSRSIKKARFRWVVQSHRGMYYYFARRSPAVVHPLLGAVVAARAIAKCAAVAVGSGFYKRHVRS